MKLGQPLLTTKMSGKLGGIVGATARGGVLYARRRVDGSNPQSPAQALVRSIISTLSSTWQNTLTESQRNGWASKAKPEESGIDVYVRANFQQLLTGLAAATPTAPASVALGDTPITAVGEYDIADGELDITLPAGTQTQYAYYLSKPQNASRAAQQFPFTYAGNAGAGDTELTISSVEGILAGITVGQVFYIRLVAFGSASPKLGRVGEQQIFRITAMTT